MSDNADFRKEIEDRIVDPYDKSVVDLDTVAGVIQVAAMQDYMWQTYHKLTEWTTKPELPDVFIRLGLDEQRHGDVTACLSDRSETALEKTVAAHATYIKGLAEFCVNEPDQEIGTAYEYILGDHLGHHRQFSHKLSQKEGLSPLARADFTARSGRPIEKQLIDIKDAPKRPYDRKQAAPITKAQIRLALAAELAQRQAYQKLIMVSKDKHLIMLYQQASIIDNQHIATLHSLIDPHESMLEFAYLAELAEVIGLERAVESTPPGRIRNVFAALLDEDRKHLGVIRSLLAENAGCMAEELARPWPALKTVDGLDAVVGAIDDNSRNIISKAKHWRRAA